ncbi:MAG: hypothetical protein QM598_10235 [Protaetiibacter sp.]
MASEPDMYIDGVPVWTAPGRPGVLTARLLIGVGMRDEAARTAGLAHLAEHLVMRGVGRTTVEHNAQTELEITSFWAHGSPGEVVDHLARLCMSITQLPHADEDAVRTECDIVAAELGDAGENPGEGPLRLRYGVRGIGLGDYGAPAHRSFTGDDVAAFAASWMHRGNVALQLSGELPDGLRLPLPEGTTPERFRDEEVPHELPAWGGTGRAPVVLSFLVPSVTPGVRALAAAVLALRLRDDLRVAHGLVYHPTVELREVDASSSLAIVGLDPLAQHAETTAIASVQLLRTLAGSGVSSGDLAFLRGAMVDAEPDDVELDAVSAARAYLRGRPFVSRATVREQIATATAEQVDAVLRGALDTLLVQTRTGPPDPSVLARAGIPRLVDTPAPGSTVRARVREAKHGVGVVVRPHRNLMDPAARLVVHTDRIVLIAPAAHREIRLDALAAVGRQLDGAYLFDGLDGGFLYLRPGVWDDTRGALRAFLERVPEELSYRRETSFDA